MKRALFAIAVMLLLAPSAWTQDAKPNFSGTWNVDLAKSDFGPAPPPESLVAVIDHKEPNVKFTTTQKGPMGEISNGRTLTTDGKENVNKMRTMAGDQDATSTTTWSGKKLATATKMDMQGMAIVINETWELAEDGKVLTIAREIKTSQGDFATKTVFNKQ